MHLKRLGLILITIIAVLFLYSGRAPANQPPTGIAAPQKNDSDKWREDLRYLAEEMPRRHKNLFHTMTREQFAGAVKALEERIPTLARHQIIVEMARILALVGDGHTHIAPTRDPKIGFRTYPIALYLFKDGLYVRAAIRDHADLVGARVLEIGRATAERACAAVRELIGRDNEMDMKFFAPFLLAMPEVLHALGLIAEMDAAPFITESQGRRTLITLKPLGPAEMMPGDTDTSWSAKENWVDARDGAKSPTPLWLKDPQNKFWFEYLPDSRAVYVQFNQVGNKETETIEAFSKRLFSFVEANPVDRLVLDLRLNRGGDGGLNRPLLLGIIRSIKIDQRGKLFVLIGRSTWSAAQMLVNELEKYTNAIFVGEPTGGKVNCYGDSSHIILPNSGITARVSTLWWQEDERDERPWKAPDIAAELTIADYRANRDPALQAALGYVRKKSLGELMTEALAADNLEAVGKGFDDWRSDPANAYVDAEPLLNSLGYELMTKERIDQAIRVFQLNVAVHPQSANASDSLGEAYLAIGDTESAIRNYEEALALNPKMISARDALRKLRGTTSMRKRRFP